MMTVKIDSSDGGIRTQDTRRQTWPLQIDAGSKQTQLSTFGATIASVYPTT